MEKYRLVLFEQKKGIYINFFSVRLLWVVTQ